MLKEAIKNIGGYDKHHDRKWSFFLAVSESNGDRKLVGWPVSFGWTLFTRIAYHTKYIQIPLNFLMKLTEVSKRVTQDTENGHLG